MGIKRLSDALRRLSAGRRTIASFEELGARYPGGRAAIDAAIFMYKFKARGGDLCRAFENQVRAFRAAGITPYYFFDGRACAAKTTEVETRRAAKARNRSALAQSERTLADIQTRDLSTVSLADIECAEEEVCRARRRVACVPRGNDYAAVRRTLRDLGVPVWQSLADGEKACAWSLRAGLTDFVVTEDYDTLVYGADRVVMRLGHRDGMIEYDLPEILGELGWTRDQFVDFCILLGSDLCPARIKGIGVVSGRKLVTAHGSLETIVDAVRSKHEVPPDFLTLAAEARAEFGDTIAPQARLVT